MKKINKYSIMRTLFLVLAVAFSATSYSQDSLPKKANPDTVLYRFSTSKSWGDSVVKYALEAGGKPVKYRYEIYNPETKELKDVETGTIDSGWYYMEQYNRKKRLDVTLAKPITKLDENEVLDYLIGEDIDEILMKLAKANIPVRSYYSYYRFTLLCKSWKGTVKVPLEILARDDGEITNVRRLDSSNTLPTNDVRTAFRLIRIRDILTGNYKRGK